MYQNNTGQVLGASTALGGIALLPNTGDSQLVAVLATLSLIAGLVVLSSFTFARLIKRIKSK